MKEKMRIHIHPAALVWVIGSVLLLVVIPLLRPGGSFELDDLGEQVAAWIPVGLAALLHELGHMAVAWGCGVPIRRLRLDLFGARMTLGGMMSYRREAAMALGGPFVNLLCAALLFPGVWAGNATPGVTLFFVASLGLAGLNLLPVATLDGGRILSCILSILFGERVATFVLRLTTALCLMALWFLSVYALLRAAQMLAVFGFSLCLLCRMCRE